jgi:hypothetical protein
MNRIIKVTRPKLVNPWLYFAALILGVVWSLWHLTMFFIPGSYQAGLGVGTVAFWLFFLAIVPLSIPFTWIYNNTNRCILSAILFHAMVNFTGELILLSERADNIYNLLWFAAAFGIAAFFVLTFCLSWIFWIPMIFISADSIYSPRNLFCRGRGSTFIQRCMKNLSHYTCISLCTFLQRTGGGGWLAGICSSSSAGEFYEFIKNREHYVR